MDAKPIIAIQMGDPAGIGPEVIAKALASGEVYPLCRPVVIGSTAAMEMAVKIAGAQLSVRTVDSVNRAGEDPNTIDVLDRGNLNPEELKLGQASAAHGRAMIEWRKHANELLATGQVQAVVNGPVNSESLRLAGGGEAYQPRDPQFSFNGPLRIAALTDHVTLRQAIEMVKRERVLETLELIHRTFEKYGIPNPRIGVAGLNPHAQGPEDQEEIAPAVEAARSRGINAIGPKPPDSVFYECAEGMYDVVLAMTHDQRNIAQKTRKLEGTVNASSIFQGDKISLGVSHGTAYNIVGKGIAKHDSMLAAIKTAATLATGKGFPRG